MNNKTKFELDECIIKLEVCREALSVFSSDINSSIEYLEEAVFTADNDYDFTNALDNYESVFLAYRKLKDEMVKLSKTVIELNGYECNVVNK